MTDPASGQITYRAARPEDSADVARLFSIAGGGLYEFLFEDLIPFMSTQDILSRGVADDDTPISYRNCRVATAGEDGAVVGAANLFPADLLKNDSYSMLAPDRHEHVRAMVELQDWGSMFLNSLATDEACRGRGIGAALIAWCKQRTEAEGFDRLSLHVWADNTAAIRFYEAQGFVRIGIAEVAPHPLLDHKGGSVLMRWRAR